LKKEKKVLPQSLLQSLNILQKMARNLYLFKYLSSIGLLCLSMWGILFIVDRLVETPQWFRLGISILSMAGTIYFSYRLILHAYILPRSPEWLARRIKDRFGGPGDRFLGVIELNKTIDKEEKLYSKALFLAAQDGVEKEISRLPLQETLSRKKTKQIFLALSLVILTMGMGVVSYPKLAINSLIRWVNPWSELPRATLTKFNPIPNTWIVPRKEIANLKIELNKNTQLIPDSATLKGKENLFIEADRNESFYEFSIPGLSHEYGVNLKAGDFRKKLTILPMERPKITQLEAAVSYPSYLGLKTKKVDFQSRTLRFPIGTSLHVMGECSRSISFFKALQSDQNLDVTFQGKSFTIQVPALTEDQNLRLQLIDSVKLSPAQSTQIKLSAFTDKPPAIGLPDSPSEASILLHETIPVRVSSSDDLGLARVQLCMVVLGGKKESPPIVLFDEKPSEQSLQSAFTLPFDPDFFNLKDSVRIELYGLAWDQMPNRKPTISRKVQFQIVGIEKHAEQLRDEIEAIMARTSEIIREQENILMETTALKIEFAQQEKEIGAREEKEINQLADLQRETAQHLKNAARDGMNILDEAIRNPIFKTQSLEALADTFKKMEEIASDSMSEASNKIDQANTPNPIQSSEKLKEAEKSEQQAIQELTKILSESSKQLDQLEARTLSQRLRKIEKNQSSTSKIILKMLPQSIGQPSQKLNIHLSEQGSKLEQRQIKTHFDAEEVKGEISRYHERTGKPVYGEVSKLMESEKAEEKILLVANKITKNISFVALDQLDILSQNFGKWADMLEESDPGTEGGNAQGIKNSESRDLTQIILSLLKIRDNEKDIISKTKVLQNGNFQAIRENWTKKLQLQQEELMVDLTDVQIETAEDALNPIFDDAHTAMSESATNLKKDKYGSQTLNFQMEARNLVSDLINLILESSPQSAQSQEMQDNEDMSGMEFLLLQMKQEEGNKPGKMLPGSTGGGSKQGGQTDRKNGIVEGQVFEKGNGVRKSKNTTGSSFSIPAEFKKIMENYFREIE
jgi:hypothetical protein